MPYYHTPMNIITIFTSPFRSIIIGRKAMSHRLTPICKPTPVNNLQLKPHLPYAHLLHRPILTDQIVPQERQSSFDKIINQFDRLPHTHNKQNTHSPYKLKGRTGRDSPVATERIQSNHHPNHYDLSNTERVKQNLIKLRSHYCFLPDISDLKKRRPTIEMDNEDYQKFQKRSQHESRMGSGQRKPLGFLKIGKLKYQKSMVFLNQ